MNLTLYFVKILLYNDMYIFHIYIKGERIMKKTRFIAIMTIIALCLSSFVGCGKAGEEKYVIGFSGPLTGAAAMYGQAVQNSAQMAIDEINEAGGLNGVKFELVATDDQHDPTKVSTNYASMLEKGMQVSLGTVTTGPGLEFKKLSKDDNVFFLTPSASGDDIPEFDNGYQMCFADGNQGGVAAAYVNENYKGQTIGIFYKQDDAYSKGIFDQFKANLDPSIKTVEALFTDANATDLVAQIGELKACKFIFMPIYYTPASIFMTQAKDIMAADTIYYGCDGFDGIEGADGFKIEEIPQEITMLSHFNSKATDGLAKEYVDKYTKAYKDAPLNQFGASAYDCVYAIFNAMKAAIDAGKEISVDISASDLCEILKEQFEGGFTYTGVTGNDIKWDANGYVQKGAVKYVIKEATK